MNSATLVSALLNESLFSISILSPLFVFLSGFVVVLLGIHTFLNAINDEVMGTFIVMLGLVAITSSVAMVNNTLPKPLSAEQLASLSSCEKEFFEIALSFPEPAPNLLTTSALEKAERYCEIKNAEDSNPSK